MPHVCNSKWGEFSQNRGNRDIFQSKSSPDETSNRIVHRLLVCHTKYETNICSHRYPSMTNYLGVPISNWWLPLTMYSIQTSMIYPWSWLIIHNEAISCPRVKLSCDTGQEYSWEDALISCLSLKIIQDAEQEKSFNHCPRVKTFV